ncbi:MAG: hypothetical protein JXR84_13065 [Anaerolineae bacterium]|nr:hypothetical protein [Anaerolineae bacterium]
MSELKGFGLALAEHLPGWEFDTAYWQDRHQRFARLMNADIPGACVYVQCARGRAEISGGYPDGFHPRTEEDVRITVSMEREVEAVARDIERRFLGTYLEKFHAAMEIAYRVAQAQVKTQDVADELATILGCSARHDRDRSSIWSRHGALHVACGSEGPYITVERLYGLSVELAKAIARVMAQG